MKREIDQVVTGNRAVDGAGVNLVRVLGRPTVESFDPFLMMDAFDSVDPRDYTKGFPWHPHRGIETVTYLVKGHIEHGDSLGNKGDILDGGCQWMTAGSGIMHQEMPLASERMLGLQLWLNLPKADKMTPPKYNDITAKDVPVVQEEGVQVSVISGHYKDAKGKMEGDHVKMTMLDVKMDANAEFNLPTPNDVTAFAYLFSGDGRFGGEMRPQGEKQALLFTKGDEINIKAGDNGAHMVICYAKALKEPVAWGGPIVMNTREELMKAFDELDRGTFIKG